MEEELQPAGVRQLNCHICVPAATSVSSLSARFMVVGRRPRSRHGRGSAEKGSSTLGVAPKTSPWTQPGELISSSALTRSSMS